MTQKKNELTNKWIGFINEEEHKSFNKVIRSIKEIRLKDFQYKVTNKTLVTKSFLHKINKVDNNICEYCNLQPETIYHLFIECEIVKRFWNELRIWLGNNSTLIIELGGKKIACQDKRNTLRNYLCIIAKYYIYVTKFTRNRLLLENFISLLKKKFQSEKYIVLMSNTVTSFFAKWAPPYNHFNVNARQ